MNLAELILSHKDGRSFADLERDCGGSPKAARLQQLVASAPKNFPDPPTIVALSRGLNVMPATVVLAAAESLGIDVRRAMPALLDRLPSGVDTLSDQQIRMIVDLARTFVQLNDSANAQRFFLTGMMDDANVTFKDSEGVVVTLHEGVDQLMATLAEEEAQYPGSVTNFYEAFTAGIDHVREHAEADHHIVITLGEIEDISISLEHAEPQEGENDGSTHETPEAQKNELDERRARAQEVSDADDRVAPAALDTVEGLDEEPGGSEPDES